jgi:ABC-type branched-subunit amino acid transport system substrate-binding protein
MDFNPIAIKAINMKPDLFYLHGVNGEAEIIQAVKAMRDAGYEGLIHASYMTPRILDELIARVGKEGVEGIDVIYDDPTMLPESIRPKEAVELRKNYEEYYGKWETAGASWVGNWFTWLTAVKKVDSLDPDKIMSAIGRDFEVKTPIGPGKFFTRPDLGNPRYCDYSTMVVVGVIRNGKIEFDFSKDADWAIGAIEQVYGMKMR